MFITKYQIFFLCVALALWVIFPIVTIGYIMSKLQ